jgi:hypothetical protein
MAIWDAAAGGSGQALMLSRRVKRAAVIAAVLAAACLIAFLAFVAGEHQQRPATVLSGIATVGDHEATVTVAGWSYGIEGNIVWVDQEGTTHEGGWPACLGGPARNVPVTFGEVPVTTPDGTTWRQVVWVDCRS